MNKGKIRIHLKSYASVTLETTPDIEKELYQFFSVFATNYHFNPKYKAKIWDGRLRFFKLTNNELPIGLVFKVYEFAAKGGYEVECTYPLQNKASREDLKKFIDSLGLPEEIELRPYQFEAVYGALIHKNLNVLISTAGGKSLVIYIVCRLMMAKGLKTLLICSKKGLVEQMFKDFQSYNFDAETHCHRIYGGQRKFYDAPIIISTWQSLITPRVKKDNPYEDFDCVICDEVHEAAQDAGSIQKIASYCVNGEYRFGFSGTYPEETCAEWFTITGAFGKITEFATYKHLQENGYIAQNKMYTMMLEYEVDFKREVHARTEKESTGAKKFALQNDLIWKHEGRNKFIVKMTENLKGNTLILFTKKEKHGYILWEYFKNHFPEERLVYIDGDTPLEDREDIRALLESRSDLILLATYGTLAAGWNVKNLMNLILASGYKSRIKVMQSIGRSLRLHKNKDMARIFDVVDNASFIDRAQQIRFINYAMDHYNDRLEYYKRENWNVEVKKYKI